MVPQGTSWVFSFTGLLKGALMDLRREVTVFLISAGYNPNYDDVKCALGKQDSQFILEEIKDQFPMSFAFQQMLDRCKTKYQIQCDSDMLLDNNAVTLLYNGIIARQRCNPKTSMYAAFIYDPHLEMNICGIKIYDVEMFRKYPFNLESNSCEVEQLARMTKDGYECHIDDKIVVGKHSPKWTNELVYERYFTLVEKMKEFMYSWTEKLPSKLLEKFKRDPNDINLYAMLGAMESASKHDLANTGEKVFFNMKKPAQGAIEAYLQGPTRGTLFMTSKCNLKCSWCRRGDNYKPDAPDIDIAMVEKLLRKFPSIKSLCLCFTGDTKVRLTNGTDRDLRSLRKEWEINKKPIEIYSLDKNKKMVPALAVFPEKTRKVEEIMEITLDSGEKIKCTTDHKFMLKSGKYKEAKDLEYEDSLMPFYVSYEKNGNNNYYERILGNGLTHKVFAKHLFGNYRGVVHHVDGNSKNNSTSNLVILSPSEHSKLHANSEKRIELLNKARTDWNNSIDGINHLENHNRSNKMKKTSSINIKKILNSEMGRKRTRNNLRKMNSPEGHLVGEIGKYRSVFNKIIKANLDITLENFDKVRKLGNPSSSGLIKRFGTLENAIDQCFYNHKIIEKRIIKLAIPEEMFCLEVPKYHNFALTAGVFVHNCGQGEPFASVNLPWVLQYLNKIGIYSGLISNGTLLTSKWNSLVVNNALPGYLSVSLNAGNREDYKTTTGVDTFETVLEGIRLVNKRIPVYLSYVVTKSKIDKVPEFLQLASTLPITGVHLHNLLPHCMGDSYECPEFWDEVLQKDDQHLIDTIKALPEAKLVTSWPILIKKYETRRNCKSPWKTLNVDGNGSISICFDKETEILTNEGWKFFKDLRGDEKVYNLDYDNKTTIWSPILEKIENPFEGELHHYKNRDTDLMVTPEHGLWGELIHDFHIGRGGKKYPQKSKGFQFIRSEDLNKTHYIKVPMTSFNTVESQEYFEIPEISVKFTSKNQFNSFEAEKTRSCPKILFEDFAELLGWYLSEGCLISNKSSNGIKCMHSSMQISQKKNCEELEELLNRLPIHWNKFKHKITNSWRYVIHNRALCNFIFDTCGETTTKRIPDYIKNASSTVINKFLYSYILGDGCRDKANAKGHRISIITSVKQLADDLQELIIRAGGNWASINEYGPQPYKIRNHSGISKKRYVVSILFNKNKILSKKSTKKGFKLVPYNDKVYCVNTITKIILVRRNGRITWSGNCNSIYPCDAKNGNINDGVVWNNDYCREFRHNYLTKQEKQCSCCFRNFEDCE